MFDIIQFFHYLYCELKEGWLVSTIPVYLRVTNGDNYPKKMDTLSREGELIYNDDGAPFEAHVRTILKFTVLTIASPLVTLARLVRSAAFLGSGDLNRAGREFVGALATPLVEGLCLAGSLLSAGISLISCGRGSCFAMMRRAQAYFEAWINGIDLSARDLPSYSQRVSSPTDYRGRVWTTAPCMQPILEHGLASAEGLMDVGRMRKVYPFFPIDKLEWDSAGTRLIIQTHDTGKDVSYTTCDGACEHKRLVTNCLCYRIETAHDRALCCTVGRGTCSTGRDSCGVVTCGAYGVGAICCYMKDSKGLSTVNTGCLGGQALSCVSGWTRNPSRF